RFFPSVGNLPSLGAGEICYPLDSRRRLASQHSPKRRGIGPVQAEEFQHSIRPGLVIMLPRLMRFADVLVGARDEGTALVRRALQRMLAEEHCYTRDVALDVWAFGEIYRQWLDELREHVNPMAPANIEDQRFARLFGEEGEEIDTM